MVADKPSNYTLTQAMKDVAALRNFLNTPLVQPLNFADQAADPPIPGVGIGVYSLTSNLKYVSADGNAYNTGRLTLISSLGLNLNNTPATVPGLSAPLSSAVGNYHFRSQVLINPTVSGGTLIYKIAASGGLVASSMRASVVELNGTSVGVADWIGSLGGTLNGSAIGVGLADRVVQIDGWIAVTTSGTLNIQGQLTSGAAATIVYGTYLEVFPVP